MNKFFALALSFFIFSGAALAQGVAQGAKNNDAINSGYQCPSRFQNIIVGSYVSLQKPDDYQYRKLLMPIEKQRCFDTMLQCRNWLNAMHKSAPNVQSAVCKRY